VDRLPAIVSHKTVSWGSRKSDSPYFTMLNDEQSTND